MREDVELVLADGVQHHVADYRWIKRLGHQFRHARLSFFCGGVRRRADLQFRAGKAVRSIARGREDVGTDDARAKHRYADVVLLHIGQHRLGNADHGELGCRVDGEAGNGEMAGHGCGVDEVAAFAVCLDAPGERLNAVDDAIDVDVGQPIPIVVAHLVDGAADDNAGVVADHVDLAETRLGIDGRLLHLGSVRHVHLQRQELGVAGLELLGDRIERGLFDVRDDHLHSSLGERSRHCQAHAAGTAGDECGLAGYLAHVEPPLAFSAV